VRHIRRLKLCCWYVTLFMPHCDKYVTWDSSWFVLIMWDSSCFVLMGVYVVQYVHRRSVFARVLCIMQSYVMVQSLKHRWCLDVYMAYAGKNGCFTRFLRCFYCLDWQVMPWFLPILQNLSWYATHAGATPPTYVYVYIEIHRSGKLSVNHKGNTTTYMHKYCATA